MRNYELDHKLEHLYALQAYTRSRKSRSAYTIATGS